MIKVNKSSKPLYHHTLFNLPEDMEEDNPLDIENIKEKQNQDDVLQQSATRLCH
jgi:hypothetical protein